MKSFINKIKNSSVVNNSTTSSQESKKANKTKGKEKLEKEPRIDTEILRNRIAEKLAKANNY